MNNKGFTLVELLATIVIISIVGLIAYFSGLSYIDNAGKKLEENFLSEISKEIDVFLQLYSMKFEKTASQWSFEKKGAGSEVRIVDVWKMKLDDSDYKFTLQDLVSELNITDKFQNPRTEGVCSIDQIEIEVYKDSDYVYYYYVDMSNDTIGCSALSNIDTRPDKLKEVLCGGGIIDAC